MARIPCPPKDDPKWEALVSGLGDESRAALAYFRHGSGEVPDLATAKGILGGFEGVAPEVKATAEKMPWEMSPEEFAQAPKYKVTTWHKQAKDVGLGGSTGETVYSESQAKEIVAREAARGNFAKIEQLPPGTPEEHARIVQLHAQEAKYAPAPEGAKAGGETTKLSAEQISGRERLAGLAKSLEAEIVNKTASGYAVRDKKAIMTLHAAVEANPEFTAAQFREHMQTGVKRGDFTQAQADRALRLVEGEPVIPPASPEELAQIAQDKADYTKQVAFGPKGKGKTLPEPAKPPVEPPSSGGARQEAGEPKLVGIKNAETEKTLGEPRVKPEVLSEQAQMDSVKKDIKSGRIKPEKVVTQLSNGETPDLEPWEVQRTLHYRTAQLDNEFEDAVKAQSEAGKSGDAKAIQAAIQNYDEVKAKVDELAKACQESGTPLGRGLQARVAMMKAREFELVHVISRAEAKKGGPLTSEERAAFQAQIEDLKASAAFGDTLQNVYYSDIGLDPENITKGQHRLVTNEEYEAAKKLINDSFLGSNKGAVGPQFGEGGKVTDLNFEHVKAVGKMIVWNMEEGGLRFRDAVEKVVKDSGEAIRPYIEPALKHLRDTSDKVTTAALDISEARKQVKKAQSVVDALEAKKAPKRERLAKLQAMKDNGEMLKRGGGKHKLTDAENDMLDKQIAKLTKELTPPKTVVERTSDAIKAVQTKIEHLEELKASGEMMTPARKVQVNNQLAALRKRASDLTKELTPPGAHRPPKSPYELLADGKKRLAAARQKMVEQLESGVIPNPRNKMAIDNEYIAAREENRALQMRIKAQSEPTRPQGTLDKIQEKTGILKTLAFSSPHWLRPDMGMLGANPRAFIAGLKAGVKSFVSPEAYTQAQGRVNESPYYNFAKGVGLDNSVSPVHGSSEFFGSDKPAHIRFFGKWFTRNAESYVVVGNVARQYAFDAWIDARGGMSAVDAKEAGDYAKVLNDITRRGATGLQGNTAKLANIVFSSPKAMAGDIQSYTDVFNPKLSAEVRKIAARSLAVRYAAGMGFMGLASLAGAKVHLNPLDRKFGTVEVGNTSLGVFGGIEIAFRDVAEAVYQGATGKTYSAKMVKGSHFVPAKWGHDPWEVIFNLNTSGYLGSHMSPFAGEVRNIAMSQEKNLPPWEQPVWREKPADIAEEFVYPIGAKALVDAWKDGGFGRALLVSPFALTGLEATTTKPMKTLKSAVDDLNEKLKTFPRTQAGDEAAFAYAEEHGAKTGLLNPDTYEGHVDRVRYPSEKRKPYKPSLAQQRKLGITPSDNN